MELKEIYKPIQGDLDRLEKKIARELENDDPFIAKITRYLAGSRGKRLRPALVLFSTKIHPHTKIFGVRINGNGQSRNRMELATALELIHTATLIHDDIIDHSDFRRGKLSIPARWGNETAVLLGDYLYSKAFKMITSIEVHQITKRLLETTNTICEGEIAGLKLVRRPCLGDKEYLKLISRKTASLFSACCEAGAILAGSSDNEIKVLADFGKAFGMTFQIVDDYRDLASDKKEIGKAVGAKRLKTKARFFASEAKEKLSFLSPSQSKNSFNLLIDYVLSRLN